MNEISVTNADGTSEHYTMTSDDAYALVMDELASPTPGTVEVSIRTVVYTTPADGSDEHDMAVKSGW